MADDLNNSIARFFQVFECLCADDFTAKSATAVSERTGLPVTTTWRILKTAEAHGWVAETAQKEWRPTDRLIGLSAQYRRHVLGQVQSLEQQYLRTTGEPLR